jgi:uncharacterized protein
MFGVISVVYWGVGRYWIDAVAMRSRLQPLNMNIPLMVYGVGTFQTLVNSYIEEYVWRGFVYEYCRVLCCPRWAIIISALFFTIHHVILMAAYLDHVWLILLVW